MGSTSGWTLGGSDDPPFLIQQFPTPLKRPTPEWVHNLPPHIEGLLSEVYSAIATNGLTLAAMGVRTLIDRAAADRASDPEQDEGFRVNLWNLFAAGYMGTRDHDVLLKALEPGDAAVHRRHRPLLKTVLDCLAIAENLLHRIYVQPQLAIEIESSTPPRKRKPKSSG